MTNYPIYDAADPRERIATIPADSWIDALADYAVLQGYADPRGLEDGPEYFSVWFDGTGAMIYENTELITVTP